MVLITLDVLMPFKEFFMSFFTTFLYFLITVLHDFFIFQRFLKLDSLLKMRVFFSSFVRFFILIIDVLSYFISNSIFFL